MSAPQVLQLAKQGHPEAQNKIGDIYYYGDDETEQDFDQALMWYEKAAKQDNVDAEYALGLMYDDGEGVEQDLKKL
jgi:TPR repeat protein